jgi:hypothetical protein
MKNWKTTLLGILGGASLMFGQMANARQAGGPPITAGNVLPGIAMAILGAVAKDYDKSNAPSPIAEAHSTK